MNKKILTLSIFTAVLSTGCANVHEFINGDFLNTLSPTTANAAKVMFYSERYSETNPAKMVPKSFGNTAEDYIGDYKFSSFTQNKKNPDQYYANYYVPVKATSDVVTVKMGIFSRYPDKTKSNKDYSSIAVDYEFNCANNTLTPLAAKAYSGNRFNGTLVSDKVIAKNDQKPLAVPQVGAEKIIFDKVCK